MEQTQKVNEIVEELKQYDGAMLLSHEYFQELNIAIFKDLQDMKEKRRGA